MLWGLLVVWPWFLAMVVGNLVLTADGDVSLTWARTALVISVAHGVLGLVLFPSALRGGRCLRDHRAGVSTRR